MDTYSLQGILNDKDSEPFACTFGSFRVHVKEQKGSEILASIQGIGILVNSSYLTPSVSTDADITFRFPSTSKVSEGMKLSAFCNDSGKPMEATVTYFVKEKSR